MTTLYERCKPREWMNRARPYVRWLPPLAHQFIKGTYLNIPADDFDRHWQLEGPRAPEEVK